MVGAPSGLPYKHCYWRKYDYVKEWIKLKKKVRIGKEIRIKMKVKIKWVGLKNQMSLSCVQGRNFFPKFASLTISFTRIEWPHHWSISSNKGQHILVTSIVPLGIAEGLNVIARCEGGRQFISV